MTTDDQIQGEKRQYDVSRKATKTSSLIIINMNILQAKKYYLLIKSK